MSYTRNNYNPANATPVWIVSGGTPGVPPDAVYLEHEQITDFAAAKGLTPPEGATYAVVQVNGGSVRYLRDDDPTASVGMVLYATGTIVVSGAELDTIRFINLTGSTSILDVEYYGVA